jgi:hypothetical protein
VDAFPGAYTKPSIVNPGKVSIINSQDRQCPQHIMDLVGSPALLPPLQKARGIGKEK